MRQPAPSITSTLLVILAHPLGKLFAYWLPITTHRLPRWLGGGEWSLNPGPWNIKEHALVYMMSNVATGAPYAIQATISIDINYGLDFGYWFNTVLILATQLTGFGLAGMCKRMLVYPASMIWPQNLIVCTLLNTLHAEEDEPRGGISRFRYLIYVGTGAFVFYFLPGESLAVPPVHVVDVCTVQVISSRRCPYSHGYAGSSPTMYASTKHSAYPPAWA